MYQLKFLYHRAIPQKEDSSIFLFTYFELWDITIRNETQNI